MTIRKITTDAIDSGTITENLLHVTVSNKINAAYATANTANGSGSGAYDQANAAYGQANTARSDANTTFATVNTTFGTINTNYQAAYTQANTARSDANTTFATVNTTFGTINTSLSTINSSFSTTNTNYQAAYAQANTARDTANNAYNNSNTKLSTSGGSISGDLSITGNLVVQGNATTINVSNLSVNDSIILLAAGGTGDSIDIGFVGHIQRGATDTHAGLIRKATQNQFYLFDNYETEPTNNVIDVAGNNFRVGNLRLGIINANSFVTAAGMDVTGQANAAYGQANAAYGQANSARSDANTTFATVNTTFATINTTTATMNTATSNRVLKAGDTMTGALVVGANVSVSTGNYFRAENPGTGRFGLFFTDNTGTQLSSHNGFGEPLTLNAPDSTAYMTFRTAGNERIRILSSGNVGIGTTNPSTKLDVWGDDGGSGSVRLVTKTSGTGSYQQIWRVSNTGSTVNDAIMQLFDNGTARISMAANAARGGDAYFNTGGALIVNGTGTVNGATLTAIRTDLSSSLSVGYFGTGSQGLFIKNDSSDSKYMQFYSSGNSTGGYRFYVGNTLAFQLDTAATANFYNNLGVSGSGSFGSSVLCLRSSPYSELSSYTDGLDGFGGSSYDGYYAVGRPGYSSGVLQFNVGGSTGTIQFAFSYNAPAYRRNKTDNVTWSSWRQVD